MDGRAFTGNGGFRFTDGGVPASQSIDPDGLRSWRIGGTSWPGSDGDGRGGHVRRAVGARSHASF
ncbi:hypothetical protein D3C72_1122170 [compost metagenome]